MLTQSIKQEIKDHSLSDFDNEVCGLIVDNNGYNVFRAKNIHENKKNF